MTLEEIINAGALRFERAGLWFGHGTDNARDEAAWLAAHVMRLPLPLEQADLARALTAAEQQQIEHIHNLRINTRQPAAYLIHQAWFCGLEFYVDQRVLVPRSPIAELITDRFVPWADPDRIRTILDIGTGSGCIAIACAKAFPGAQVLATDISTDALAVAEINVERHAVEAQVMLLQSDLFRSIDRGRGFDLIISNPPYVATPRNARLPDEYQHEPRLGLASGERGIAHANSIIEAAAEYLTPGGVLILEVGESRGALEQHYPDTPFNWPEFEHGGEGVAIIYAADLPQHVSSR